MRNQDSSNWIERLKQLEVNQINDIDWEDMGSWPLPGKIFFAILVFLGAFFLSYFFMLNINENIELLYGENSKELQLKKDFESKAFRVANLDQYKIQMTEMEENFGSLLKQLPRDTEIPGLVDDISSAALSSGLKLNVIDPRPIVETQFYDELPIDIEVMGHYHEMGAFVSSVAALPRIVTLHDFNIRRDHDGSLLVMNILAKTYQYGGE